MAIADRRERELAQRHARIVTAARTLAEAEGWDAVTTRRLADSIEYSQPVLYSHFENRDAIVAAVAVEGFAELAASLQDATTDTPSPNDALQSLARAYVAFAISNPALYDAMFTLATLPFGQPERPAAMREGFAALRRAVAPLPATAMSTSSPSSHGARSTASPPYPHRAPLRRKRRGTTLDAHREPHRSRSRPAASPTANQEGMNRVDLLQCVTRFSRGR